MSKNLLNHKEKRLWWTPSILWGVLFSAIAVFLRFYVLDNKPIHFDESINMWFVSQIWEHGFFTYDPTNYHGPLLFYLIQAAQLVTSPDFISTRLVAALFSAGTCMLLWWVPVKERTAFRFASVILLISPAMGFYGRSGIHESTFVFFQVLFFVSFHFFAAREYRRFWWLFIAGLLGMMALKETFVILILSWMFAVALIFARERKTFAFTQLQKDLWTSFHSREVMMPTLLMALFFVGLYTGFGANPKGLADFFIALMPWLKTGVHGNGHEKEFFHWAKLMGQYEMVTLAGFLMGLFFLRKRRWILFYGSFALCNWLIYSLIPYKTPWCLISILWPFAIVAGFGFETIHLQPAKWLKISAAAVFVLLGCYQLKIFYDIQYKDPIAMDHPYVYVNSTYAMKDFISGVQEVLRKEPLLRERPIQIATEESWPLPIVLSSSFGLSYAKVNSSVVSGALIYFVDEKDEALLDQGLQQAGRLQSYSKYFLPVRQGRLQILVYLDKVFYQKRPRWDLTPKDHL